MEPFNYFKYSKQLLSYFVTGFLFRFAWASASSASFRLAALPDALYVPFILAMISESRFA